MNIYRYAHNGRVRFETLPMTEEMCRELDKLEDSEPIPDMSGFVLDISEEELAAAFPDWD